MRLGKWLALGLGLGAWAGGCASSSDDRAGGTSFDNGGDFGSSGGSTSGPGNDFGNGSGATGSGGLPPEVEVIRDFEQPQAGEHYVYAANPDTDNVAVIDASTLAIHIVPAGDQPTFLQTLAGADAAIVLNVGSADATIIRTTDGASVSTKVDVQPGSNAIQVAPDGKHAVVYYDARFAAAGDQQGSFQDATVIALEDGNDAAYPMTVGFRPTAIFFQADGSRAFAVTEDGVSILDFAVVASGGSGIARTVPIGVTGVDPTRDVSVTPDGRYALAREEGSAVIRLVDLDPSGDAPRTLDLSTVLPRGGGGDAGSPPTGSDAGSSPPDASTFVPEAGTTSPEGGSTGDASLPPVVSDAGAGDGAAALTLLPPAGGPFAPLPIPVTDLDLAPSGDLAIAVMRDAAAVLRVPIPGAFDDASLVRADIVDGELIGSVTLSPDGGRALLYTTVVPTNERITIFDFTDDTYQSVQLRKSVRSVAIAPDGNNALVIHQKLDGAPNDPTVDLDTRIDRSYGYTLLELGSGFPKIETTPSDIGPFALVPDGSTLFLLFDDATTQQVQRANLTNFFVDQFTLGSPPVSVGAVPGTQRVFVSQEHPDGRIAFIDWITGEVQSVTGFELNSQIRE